jgi:Uma2 family endonuclease
MVEAGILHERERVELIEGELLAMAAKGLGHDAFKDDIVRALGRLLPDDLVVTSESTLQLSDNTIVEPDIAVFRREFRRGPRSKLLRIDGRNLLLLIEIGASSLAYDRKVKAPLYARHGVREYWVYRGPGPKGWESVEKKTAKERLEPSMLPKASICLADLV